MLGSANTGESGNAKRKLDELLAQNGQTWNDLAGLLQEAQLLEVRTTPPAGGNHGGDLGGDQAIPNPFDLIYCTLDRYLYLHPHELVALTLWILHTFAFDRFMITPRLALLSPVRGCGKTTVLGLLSRLVYRAERYDHITPAALYRMIEDYQPTLLIDEADNMNLSTPGPLRSVFNSGHSKGWTMGERWSSSFLNLRATGDCSDRDAAFAAAASRDHPPHGARAP
jgi:hypothetical protein